METNLSTNTFALQVDGGNISYLNETAKWAKFLSILGFIFCGLFVIVGLLAGTVLSSFFSQAGTSSSMPGFSALGGGLIAVIYIGLAVLYFFPCLYLFHFASKMQAALRTDDQTTLNESFKNLKSCFKFWGIMMIIVLSIYALVFIFAIIGSAFLR